MKGHIWDLGLQTNEQGQEMYLGAWELADNQYFVLSKENLGNSSTIERVQGQETWHMTHQYIQGPLPSITIIDHTPPEIIDSYLTTMQGIQAVLIGLCKYYAVTQQQMFMLYNQWAYQQQQDKNNDRTVDPSG